MKAVFIVYGQSLSQLIEQLLDKLNIRGFTRWEEVQGRGGISGEPHYGTHAWPSENGAILTIVDNQVVDSLLDALRRINEQAEQQGLNAFVWSIEKNL
jgi:nitrogen regulatory protein PII